MRNAIQWSVGLAAVGALWAFGCGSDNQECTTCPKIEGTYALTAGQPDQSCPNGRAPPSSLTITRVGSVLRSTVEGTEVSGVLYDTFDFTLAGTINPDISAADGGALKGADQLSLRAKFIQGTGDGGVDTFRGSWAFTPAADAGSQGCTETRDVSAVRTQ